MASLNCTSTCLMEAPDETTSPRTFVASSLLTQPKVLFTLNCDQSASWLAKLSLNSTVHRAASTSQPRGTWLVKGCTCGARITSEVAQTSTSSSPSHSNESRTSLQHLRTSNKPCRNSLMCRNFSSNNATRSRNDSLGTSSVSTCAESPLLRAACSIMFKAACRQAMHPRWSARPLGNPSDKSDLPCNCWRSPLPVMERSASRTDGLLQVG
mmetsp:Transcript_30639/g.55978  ORF Transcript_30639/g.55978 Transcript_30639/m.55978 type:complete len:211 (-) Transcript_30639:1354-1986(-)